MALGGGARRAQKELIRKQRAKRKRLNGSDDDDDDGGAVHRLRGYAHAHEPIGTCGAPPGEPGDPQKEAAGQVVRTMDNRKSDPAATHRHSAAPRHERATATTATAAHKHKPLGKIERMRLKKQQQKARRKEKKALKAAAAEVMKASST